MLKNVKNRPFWSKNVPEKGFNRVSWDYLWLPKQDVSGNGHIWVKRAINRSQEAKISKKRQKSYTTKVVTISQKKSEKSFYYYNLTA